MIFDWQLFDGDVLNFIDDFMKVVLNVLIVIVIGLIDFESVVQIFCKGVYDYLFKLICFDMM